MSFSPDDEIVMDLDVEEEQVLENADEMHSSTRRLPLGPPQDSNVKPKKRIPPQVHFARVENQLNKMTQQLTMDKIFFLSLMKKRLSTPEQASECEADHSKDKPATLTSTLRQNLRNPLDEFDKRLGLRVRSTNPIAEITSAFLGPLMRIFRIICIVVRILFNIGTWNDPYLSFWALCGLILLMMVLLVFPWRIFFFVVGVVALGPQNLFLRKQLHRLKGKLFRKKDKGPKPLETSATKSSDSLSHDLDSQSQNSTFSEKSETNRRRHRRLLGHLANRRQQRRDRINAAHTALRRDDMATRQAFSAVHQTRGKRSAPRDVVVPYVPFRIDRFYDWPPDPTVSRATPVVFENCAFQAFPIGEDSSSHLKAKSV
uniref:Uncharacterized protein n=1 Tax=Cyclophora tenuis TaxID=216820 RepID=A0A7S1GKL2_CYCTE